MKKRPCGEIVQMADESRKTFRYQAESRISNEEKLDRKMKVWITELENIDLIIGQDWLQSMKPVID